MRLRLLLLIICHFIVSGLPCQAQQISVNKFVVAPLDKADRVKGKRVIDLYTQDKEYTFSTSTKDIEAKPGEEFTRLVVDKDVRYIKISHPKFGTTNWKIPVSKLKSRRLYQAEIVSPVPFEYKQQHQWLKISSPHANTIIVVDTICKKISNGEAQMWLPIGKHTIKATVPFFCDITDSILLDAEKPYEYHVKLVPNYSYLRVRNETDSIRVYIDHKEESEESLRQKKLAAGLHYLSARYKDMEYSQVFELKPSEFKEILLNTEMFRRKEAPIDTVRTLTLAQEPSVNESKDSVPVTIKAFDEHCRIYINNEYVRDGFWSGYMTKGDYWVANKRDGLSSKPIYIHIQEQDRIELTLNSPASNYGILNIESNVVNADILLNGRYVGKTPYVIKNLDASLEHTVILRKKGYKRLEKKVKVSPNDETKIVLKLNKQ